MHSLSSIEEKNRVDGLLNNTSIQEVSHYLGSIATIWQHNKKAALIGFQKRLADHVNPNQCDERGITPLWWIIVYFDLDFLTVALGYKANPFLVPTERHMKGPALLQQGFDPKAPIEYAKLNERMETYSYIVRLCTKPQASLRMPLQIVDYKTESKDDCVNIHLITNKKPIDIQIQSTKKLKIEMIRHIYARYQKHFKSSPTLRGTLDNFFMHEIQGEHKFIELLFCEGQFIAMNLHKLIRDPRFPGVNSLYISCIHVEEDFRSLGLTDPLAMTLPALMPKLFDSMITIISFQALVIGAKNLLNGLDCFPQYRTDFLSHYADVHFQHVQESSECDPNPVLINNVPGECWSEIPVQPAAEEKKSSAQLSLDELMFNRHRGLDLDRVGTERHRGVFYICFVDDEFIKKYFQSCLKMNLDASRFLNEIGKQFAKLIPELNPIFNYHKVYLPKHCMLFKNKIIFSDTYIAEYKPLRKSKL